MIWTKNRERFICNNPKVRTSAPEKFKNRWKCF